MVSDRNRSVMMMTGVFLFLWFAWLYEAKGSPTGIATWHPHMHWFDKVTWYAYMATGPLLAGFLLGVAYAGRKVYRKCRGCGEKFDAEKMRFVSDPIGQKGNWWCQKCGDSPA